MKSSIFFVIIIFLFSSSYTHAQNSTSEKDSIHSLYKKGKRQYNEGEYNKAIRSFQRVITREKENSNITELSAKAFHKLAKCQRRVGKRAEGIKSIDSGIGILTSLDMINIGTASDLYLEKSNLYRGLFRLKDSEIAFSQASDIVESMHGKNSKEFSDILMTGGNIQGDAGNYRKAEEFYLAGLEKLHQADGDSKSRFSKVYLNLGTLYRQMGHYTVSEEYLKKALKLKIELYGDNSIRVAKYYGSLGRTYMYLNKFDEAIACKNKDLEISLSTKNIAPYKVGAAYNEISSVYDVIGDDEKSYSLLKLGIAKMEAVTDLNNLYVCKGYSNLARYYEGHENYKEALIQINIAIDRYTKNENKFLVELADFKRVKARLLLQLNKYEMALNSINEALDILVDDGREYEEIKLHYLKAQIHVGHSKSIDSLQLKLALEAIMESIEIVESMKTSHRQKELQHSFSEYTYEQYDLAVSIAHKLFQTTGNINYLIQSWQLSEKSKAAILWQGIQDNEAIASGIIEQNQIDKRQSLLNEIDYILRQIETGKSENNIDSLKHVLEGKKTAYDSFVRALEKSNPTYYNRKYASRNSNVQDVQKYLDDKTIILDYHILEDKVIIFSISKDKLISKRIPLSSNTEEIIRSLQVFSLDKVSNNQYIDHLSDLYSTLISPVKESLVGIDKLIIIPHKYLNYLSFESLIDKGEELDFRSLPYLLNDYSIQYAWSSDLWFQMKNMAKKTNIPYSGFAPGFSDSLKANNRYRNSFVELPFSVKEVEAGSDIFRGKLFTKQDASKEHFIQYAPASKIFHLATHGILDTKNPSESGLMFSTENEESFLSAKEIYGLQFSSDLAVMTACNTGNGVLDKGEGVMSIGRAFFQSGCSSIVSSLWLANDESTSEVVTLFYTYLEKGMRKDEALRQAKLQYLKQTDALTAHPHFWANLTAMGNMSSMKWHSTKTRVLFPMLGILMVFMLVVLRVYTRNKKA